MPIGNLDVVVPKQISSTANIKSGQGALRSIFVSSVSGSPTITVYDDAATGTTTKIVDTFIPVGPASYNLPFAVSNGIYVVLGGTVSCTVGYV